MSGRPFSGLPDHDVPVPAAVTTAAAGRLLTLTWVNETGGLTYAAEGGGDRCFIKWAPAGSGVDLSAAGPATSTWVTSASPTGGPTWPSPPGARPGTTARAGAAAA